MGIVDKLRKFWDPPEEDDYDDDDIYDEEYYDEDEDEIPVTSHRQQRSHQRDRDRERNRDRDRDRERDETVYETHNVSNYSIKDDTQHENKVININTTAKVQVTVFQPKIYGNPEITMIADELMKTNTVVLNLEDTTREVTTRILDFLGGIAYANHGKIQRVSSNTFIITPSNVDISCDSVMTELEKNSYSFY